MAESNSGGASQLGPYVTKDWSAAQQAAVDEAAQGNHWDKHSNGDKVTYTPGTGAGSPAEIFGEASDILQHSED